MQAERVHADQFAALTVYAARPSGRRRPRSGTALHRARPRRRSPHSGLSHPARQGKAEARKEAQRPAAHSRTAPRQEAIEATRTPGETGSVRDAQRSHADDCGTGRRSPRRGRSYPRHGHRRADRRAAGANVDDTDRRNSSRRGAYRRPDPCPGRRGQAEQGRRRSAGSRDRLRPRGEEGASGSPGPADHEPAAGSCRRRRDQRRTDRNPRAGRGREPRRGRLTGQADGNRRHRRSLSCARHALSEARWRDHRVVRGIERRGRRRRSPGQRRSHERRLRQPPHLARAAESDQHRGCVWPRQLRRLGSRGQALRRRLRRCRPRFVTRRSQGPARRRLCLHERRDHRPRSRDQSAQPAQSARRQPLAERDRAEHVLVQPTGLRRGAALVRRNRRCRLSRQQRRELDRLCPGKRPVCHHRRCDRSR